MTETLDTYRPGACLRDEWDEYSVEWQMNAAPQEIVALRIEATNHAAYMSGQARAIRQLREQLAEARRTARITPEGLRNLRDGHEREIARLMKDADQETARAEKLRAENLELRAQLQALRDMHQDELGRVMRDAERRNATRGGVR